MNGTRAPVLGFLLSCSTALLAACLPHVEDPPLTETGEAPGGWSASTPGKAATGGSIPGPATCSGELNGSPTESIATWPCKIHGGVDMSTLSATAKQHLSRVSTVDGQLLLYSQADVVAFASLTSVGSLAITQVADAQLSVPGSWKVLNSIAVFGCSGLQTLTGFDNAQSGPLTSLNFSDCPKLKTISGFSGLKNTKLLSMASMPALTTVSGFGALSFASQINLTNLPALTSFSLPALTQVGTQLTASQVGCQTIALPALTQLDGLTVSFAQNLTTLTLTSLQKAKYLLLNNVTNLKSLGGLPNVQISNSISLCNSGVPCADRAAFVKAHGPTVTSETCQGDPLGCQ